MENMEKEEVVVEKSKQQEWKDRRRNKHPDKSFENEDDFYSSAIEEEDRYNEDLNSRKNKEQSLIDLLGERPQMATLLANLKDTKDSDAALSLLKMYGEDFKTSLDSEEAMKNLVDIQSERLEKEAKSKKFSEKIERDFDERLELVNSFCESKEMNEDDATKFLSSYLEFCYRGTTSQFNETDLNSFFKGSNYDTAIQEAETKGEVRGSNKKIELKKKEESQGDVPSLIGQSTGDGDKKSKTFKRSSIWD